MNSPVSRSPVRGFSESIGHRFWSFVSQNRFVLHTCGKEGRVAVCGLSIFRACESLFSSKAQEGIIRAMEYSAAIIKKEPLGKALIGGGRHRCMQSAKPAFRGHIAGGCRKPRAVVPLAESFVGTGDVKGDKFTLVCRTPTVAMYCRNNGEVYEVFRIRIRKPSNAFGRAYPAKERYPSTSDFGKDQAWCFGSPDARTLAEAKYREIALT